MARAEGLDERDSGEPTTRGREFSGKESPKPIDFIAVASSSQRRVSLVRHVFSGMQVIAFSVGEGEPDTPNIPTVVSEKLRRGETEVRGMQRRGQIKGRGAIIAADTQSFPLAINRKGTPILKPQSKPSSVSGARKVFSELAHAASYGVDPYYIVQSAAGLKFVPAYRQRDVVTHPAVGTMYLDPDKMTYYATEEGFRDYERAFANLYSSENYTRGGFKAVAITDLAAGLSLPVLTREGAIVRINEASRDSSDFPDQLRDALSVAAAGIHPAVFDNIEHGASERVNEWEFLGRLMDYSLGETQSSGTVYQPPSFSS